MPFEVVFFPLRDRFSHGSRPHIRYVAFFFSPFSLHDRPFHFPLPGLLSFSVANWPTGFFLHHILTSPLFFPAALNTSCFWFSFRLAAGSFLSGNHPLREIAWHLFIPLPPFDVGAGSLYAEVLSCLCEIGDGVAPLGYIV